MPKKFLRQDSTRYAKLGRNRKKKQVWRKPKGRDSKMRLKQKSYPPAPTIGYKSPKKRIKIIHLIHNLKELKSAPEDSNVVIAKIGARKKIALIKQARENKMKILNVQSKK